MLFLHVRDITSDLLRYLRRLRTERRIVVAGRGQPVAELLLSDTRLGGSPRQHYTALIATGVIRPALEKGNPLADWPSAHERFLALGTVRELIDEDRGNC